MEAINRTINRTIHHAVNHTINRTIYSSAKFNDSASDPDERFLTYQVCLSMPPNIISDGIWGNTTLATLPSRSTIPLFELQIITIFIITQCFHMVLKRIGVPYFVSQILAGFVLGPSLQIESLNKYKDMLFLYGSQDILTLISVIGYAFYLFLNGVQMDFSMITRTGKKAWTIALLSISIPSALGLSMCYIYMDKWIRYLGEFDAINLPVVVMGHTGCSFAVVASLLSDLEILNSELGRLALSAGLVSDVFTSVATGLGTAIVSSIKTNSRNLNDEKGGASAAAITAIVYLSFLVLVPLIARPAMRRMVRKTPEGRPVKKTYTYAVILMAFGVGMIGIFANQSVLSGILLLGLVVPEGPPLGSEMVKQLELFFTWFLLPVFVTCCAMKVDLSVLLYMKPQLALAVGLAIIVIHALKMLITIVICRHCKMPKTDGLCLSLLLSSKGVVDFCANIFMFDSMLMSSETVAMMTISLLVLGSMARIGVKALYDPARKYPGYQKRNILNLKPNSELRVVACVHKPSHILSIKNALDIFCPTSTNPLVVHVLHLMELVGRSSPIFISHRLQERVGSGHNYSEDVIVTFDLFEQDNAGTASVSTYTAISPLRFMHEDICYLALDKLASIIILPFHLRWAEDGSVASSNENIRSLNSKVLERAPCSVGILVNRGSNSNIFNTSSKEIAMIFLGGGDDREALCLAKRSIKDDSYHLVVYHLVAGKSDFANWDVMLDDEVLKGVKGVYGRVDNVTYEKFTVEDPSETTSLISDIANRHDFIIVGRRNEIKSSQTAALKNWTEFSELGVVGDLLASSDTDTKASILVVQQQQMPKS